MDKENEDIYQRSLSVYLGGAHCKLPPFGISDITTTEFHAELKVWSSWKNVIGQLFSYHYASPRNQLRAYLFAKKPDYKSLKDIVTFLNHKEIIPYHIEINRSTNRIVIENLLSGDLDECDICDAQPETQPFIIKMRDDMKRCLE
jgi:hypothetical protein